ncbi:MAG TPA: hypothetical protein VI386_37660 [Candidatus Sulfotelmatobacter sp.]
MLRNSPVLRVILYVFLAASAYGQTWSGILDPSRAVDWSQAGVTGGIPTNRSQCVTSSCAAVSGGTVTADSINAALSSAPANSYVLVPAGTFTMTSGINFYKSNGQPNSYVTLRGSGSNSTFLVFTGSSSSGNCNGHDICAASSDVNYVGGPTNSANWTGTNGSTGTYTKGANSIILSGVNNLAVGQPIILDQVDDQSDNGGLYVGCEIYDGSPACYSGAGPNGFERGSSSLSTIRGQQQVVNVTSISGKGPYTVGITPGTYASNWRTSQAPGAWWATNPVYGDAVEDISLDHTRGGDGITFFNCTGCWVKGIRSIRQSTTGTGWGHVYLSICNHCTVRDSYFYGYNGDTYGIPADVASDALVENNITQFPGELQFYNSDCEGCVASYNFAAGTLFGSPGSNWLGLASEYHGILLYSLQEGNIGAGLQADSFHGTHDLNTTFRNRWDGKEQNQGYASTSDTVALRLNPGTRYHNVIGNVLGTPGYHAYYESTAPGTNLYTSVIGAGTYPETGTNDNLVKPTTMFWGNWDVVSNAVRWCGNSSDPGWTSPCSSASEVPTGLSAYSNPVPSSTKLPASFIYSQQPAWWPSGKAWPPIGPDVKGGNVGQCAGGTYDSSEATSSSQCAGGKFAVVASGMVVSIPAMDCYLNMMGGVVNGTGSPLAFDAAACYPTTGTSTLNPPTDLSVVVH